MNTLKPWLAVLILGLVLAGAAGGGALPAGREKPVQAQQTVPPGQKPPEAKPPEKPGLKAEDTVQLNLDAVTLAELAETVFGQKLRRDYIIDPGLVNFAGRITIRMTQAVPQGRIPAILAEILRSYDIFLVEKEGRFIFMPLASAASVEPAFQYGKKPPADAAGLVCQVFPLNHVSFAQLDLVIRRFLSKAGQTAGDQSSNSLILIDLPERVRSIAAIIGLLDDTVFEAVRMEAVKTTYWSPSALVEQVMEVLKVESVPFIKPGQSPRGVYLLPVDRTREIYLFFSQDDWKDLVLKRIAGLDRPEGLTGGVRTFVYFPKNSSALDLGEIVASVLGESGGAGGASGGEARAGAPPAQAGAGQTGTAPPAEEAAAKAARTPVKTKSVIVDEKRNALIMTVEPTIWESLLDLLEQLDIPPKQVLIEAVIGELTLDKQSQLGLEWFVKHNIDVNAKTLAGEAGTQGGLGLGTAGFVYSLVSDDERFQVAVNAFISENKFKILSSPRIVGVDNEMHSINVGTDVPTVSSEAAAGSLVSEGTTSLLRNITYRKTGVILKVTPVIHESGLVTLTIDQEVSEAQTNSISPQLQSPLILSRNIQTKLLARDGQTVFIGGLISRTISGTKSGIPILSQIPLLGALFKTKSSGDRQTELVILLTPHIIRDDTAFEYATQEFKDKLLKDFESIRIRTSKKEAGK